MTSTTMLSAADGYPDPPAGLLNDFQDARRRVMTIAGEIHAINPSLDIIGSTREENCPTCGAIRTSDHQHASTGAPAPLIVLACLLIAMIAVSAIFQYIVYP